MQATYEQHTYGLFADSTASFHQAVAAPVSPALALPGQEEPRAGTFATVGLQPRAFFVGLAAAMTVLTLIQLLF